MQTLKIGPANQIDNTQAGSDRPTSVNAQQLRFRNHRRITFSKAQAAQTNPKPPQDERQQRALRTFRQSQSDAFQHDAKNFQSLIDVTAHQQLRAGSLSQFQGTS